MMTDPIADMLTRIRNAVRVERASVDMPLSKVKRGLAEVLHRSHRHQGVEVRFEDGVSAMKSAIIIDIYVIMEYGVRIMTVAHNVMERVGFAVEKALGVPVEEVNVHVQGLRVSNADEWPS